MRWPLLLILLTLAAPAFSRESLESDGRRIRVGHVPISSANAGTSATSVDPDLAPGFPVSAVQLPGTYLAGPSIHVMAVNLDADPELEIVASGQAQGPVYAWNHDGTPVAGWPVDSNGGVGYFAAGPFLPGGAPGVAVTSDYLFVSIVDGSGTTLASWPKSPDSGRCWYAPSLLPDAAGANARLFFGTNSNEMHAWDLSGSELTGWPTAWFPYTGQGRHTPGFADLDRDGRLDVIFVTQGSSVGQYLSAHHVDGTTLTGFPMDFHSGTSFGNPMGYPAIGDLDADGDLEIVVVPKTTVAIVSHSGQVVRQIPLPAPSYYGTAAALANLDTDDSLEIVVKSSDHINVMKPSGAPLPGWPKPYGTGWWEGNGGPVVGDIDGDGGPDIVITTQVAGQGAGGEVRAWHPDGSPVPGFPKSLPIGHGATPAIADIDRDGRNELIVMGDYWDGVSGTFPKVWVFDLHGTAYGGIPWGQFMHDTRHTGTHGFQSTVGVPTLPSRVRALRVTPNPVRAGSRVRIVAPDDTRIEIHDLQGRLMYRAVHPGTVEWSVPSGFGSGVLLVRAGAASARLVLVR
jgi:FG-GAP-like repeat